MLKILSSVTKAAISVVALPVAVVADIATLPATAERNDSPFRFSEALLKSARGNFSSAVKPDLPRT